MKQKRMEITLVLLILVTMGGILLYQSVSRGGKSGGEVRIEHNGSVLETVSLNENQTIEISSDGKVTNTLVIEDGEVFMKEADCPDQICVKTGRIHGAMDQIVCLPNKVIVTVEGSTQELDLTTN